MNVYQMPDNDKNPWQLQFCITTDDPNHGPLEVIRAPGMPICGPCVHRIKVDEKVVEISAVCEQVTVVQETPVFWTGTATYRKPDEVAA